jgi:hypothetical protein
MNLSKFNSATFLIIAFAIMQFIVAVFTHNLSFTHEEAMWQYIGRNWVSNGLVPYSGGVDNKSPLIFYIFGISDRLFGNNIWFPRLLGTLAQSVGVLFLYKIVFQQAGKRAANFSIIIYGFSLMWIITGGRYVSFTETYCVSLLLAAFYYALKAGGNKSYLISGVLAGAAICFRLTGVFGVIAILILITKENYKKLPAFILGFVFLLLFFGLWLLLSGIQVQDFIFYSFTDNFGSGSITDQPISLKWNNFNEAFIISPLLLFYPFIIHYLLNPKSNKIIGIWLCLEFIGIIIIGAFARNHLKHILPALSIIAGMSASALVESYALPAKWVYSIVAIVFFPKTLEPIYGIKNSLYPIPEKSEQFCTAPFKQPDPYQLKLLGQWLKLNSKPSDKVLVAGMGAQVHAYSERLSPSIYFNATQTDAAKKRFFQDVVTSYPDIILIPKFSYNGKKNNDELMNFISDLAAKKYSLNGCYFGYDLYIKKLVKSD